MALSVIKRAIEEIEMTYSKAIARANMLAKKNNRDYFVVVECGEYGVADDFALDTFYAGISQDHILYCTAGPL